MINRYIQRHHGYRESGSDGNDEDRLVLTRCKYQADEPFYDRGGYVALCDESSDHLDLHMGQGVAESGKCDATFQSGIEIPPRKIILYFQYAQSHHLGSCAQKLCNPVVFFSGRREQPCVPLLFVLK